MDIDPLDYCQKCSDSCCAPLRGLKVSRPEFDRLFASHRDRLEIKDRGAYLEISSPNRGACPNLENGVCTVYAERPMECRLFPYTIESVSERRGAVHAYVHGGTHCPFRLQLLPDRQTAIALVETFLRQAFPGRRHTVSIEANPTPYSLKAARAKRKIRTALRMLRLAS